MDTNAWGKLGWDTVYWVAARCDSEYENSTRVMYNPLLTRFLELTAELCPCIHCRISFRKFLKEENDSTANKVGGGIERVYLLHEKVNNKLRKQETEKLRSCFKAFAETLRNDADSFWTKYREAAQHICNQRDSPPLDEVQESVIKNMLKWSKTETWPEHVFQFLYFASIGLILNEEHPSFAHKEAMLNEYVQLLLRIQPLYDEKGWAREFPNLKNAVDLHRHLWPFANVYEMHCSEKSKQLFQTRQKIVEYELINETPNNSFVCNGVNSLVNNALNEPRLHPCPTLAEQFDDIMQHKAGCSSSLQTCRKKLIDFTTSM